MEPAMADLHRTQVLLEKGQYEDLKRLAATEGISLSELIRRIVDDALGSATLQRPKRPKLEALIGSVADGGNAARDHDRILYGGEE